MACTIIKENIKVRGIPQICFNFGQGQSETAQKLSFGMFISVSISFASFGFRPTTWKKGRNQGEK